MTSKKELYETEIKLLRTELKKLRDQIRGMRAQHIKDMAKLKEILDSPDDLPIVVILDLLLMTRVHRISRLV